MKCSKVKPIEKRFVRAWNPSTPAFSFQNSSLHMFTKHYDSSRYTLPRGKCHVVLERILKTPPTQTSGHCLRFQHFATSFPTCFYHLRHLVIHSLSIQMHVMCDHLAPHSSCLTRCHCRWQLRRETTGSCSLTSRRIRRSRCLEMDHFNVPRFISC